MMNFPLSRMETHTVCWVRRAVPLLATAVIAFLSALSVAAAQG